MNNYNEHFKKMKSNSFPVRMKNQRNEKKFKSSLDKQSSLKLGSFIAFILCLSFYGFLYPEHVLNIFDRVSIFSSSQAEDGATSAATKESAKEEIAAVVDKKNSPKSLKKAEVVSDNANYLQHLEDRKKALDEKEKSLKDLEEKLQLEKAALEKKVEELEGKRREIATKLESRVTEDEERMKKLVEMYSNMKPQNAAQVIASLDEELAIHVLKRMKKQDAGNVLNFMNSEKAKKLSEKYTGY